MRTAFINTLCELAKTNNRIFLLTGDLGFSTLEPFKDEFPDRFYNIGAAEANMAGIAAGLASCGKIVFIYSIMPFVSMRCYEQIKIDICYHDLNVKIIGVGGGVSYGSQGATHHANEDIAIMRVLPNIKIICPSDPFEAKEAVKSVAEIDGPAFIRLNKNNDPCLYKDRKEFSIGKGYTVKDGCDITLISTGSMVETAIKVSECLNRKDISAKVVSMHTIKPLDTEMIKKCINETKALFTIEEHNIIGGLGSAVAEVLAENNSSPLLFKRFGIPDTFIKFVGSQQHIRHELGLETDQIAEKIIDLIKQHP